MNTDTPRTRARYWACWLAAVLLWAGQYAAFADVRIQEILAANLQGAQDEDGDRPDWIELFNTGAVPVSLNGWALTDDIAKPAKWIFPDTSIGAGAFLVVFASGKDRRTPASQLHTNFELSRKGGYLGLYNASGQLVDQVGAEYPKQRADVSYGRYGNSEWRFWAPPTPGAADTGSSSFLGLTEPPVIDPARGFYEGVVAVTMSSPTPDSVFWYTLDGSSPIPNSSNQYTQPLIFSNSTVLQAIAVRTGWYPSDPVTHTFLINVDDFLKTLPAISIVGDPEESLYEPNGVMAIVGGAYTGGVGADRSWVPVADADYNNPMQRGADYERIVSTEYLLSNGEKGFHTDCGIRVHGSPYHRERYRRGGDWLSCTYPEIYNKFSFKLYFRDEYGDSELTYPLFPEPSLNESNVVILRGGHNDTCSPFIRDELFRRLHADMGYAEALGTFSTLFINGEYKGLYNPTERVDEQFLQERFGNDTQWDVITDRSIKEDDPRDGDLSSWNALIAYVESNLLQSDDAYQTISGMVDLTGFIDFVLLELYAGNMDWPHHNWVAARQKSTDGKFIFFLWDTEWSMDTDSLYWNGFYMPGGGLNQQDRDIGKLFGALRKNANFRQLFADRVQKHFFNNGVLTSEHVAARFNDMRQQILPVFPDIDPFITDTFIPQRSDILLQYIREEGLYPLDAPAITVNGLPRSGGRVSPGDALNLSSTQSGSSIFYTLDGTDPRQAASWQGTFNALFPEAATKRILVPTIFSDAFLYPKPFNGITLFSNTTVERYGRLSALDTHAAETLFRTPALWTSSASVTSTVINFANTGEGGHFDNDQAFPGTTLGEDADDFAFFASADLFIPAAGYWTFGVNSDEGFGLKIGDFFSTYDDQRLPADSLSLFTFTEPGVYSLFLGYFERTGGAELELYAAPGYYETFDPEVFHLVGDVPGGGLGTVQVWNDPAFDDSAWAEGAGGAGYDTGATFAPYIGVNLASAMQGNNSTCYLRIPFAVEADDLAALNLLLLKVRYADGFVAYLNGVRVIRANAPTTPQWNSIATLSRTNDQAIILRNFDISNWISLLHAGENILALQGLSESPDADNFLLSAELAAGVGTTGPANVLPAALEYKNPIPVDGAMRITARVYKDGVWGPLIDTIFSSVDPAKCLRITELMYNPRSGRPEFLELQNVCSDSIDLSDAYFSNGIDFVFPPNTILGGGEYLVLTDNAEQFEEAYPGAFFLGVYAGQLSNSGETLALNDAQGASIFSLTYSDSDPWPSGADGDGRSLMLLGPSADPSNPANWRASMIPGGSPGWTETSTTQTVRINEVLPKASGQYKASIEIFNPTSAVADIRGWLLSNEWDTPAKARIPNTNDFVIPAGGYAVVTEEVFTQSPGQTSAQTLPGFAFDACGTDDVYIFAANPNGIPTGYNHGFKMNAVSQNQSLGRFVIGASDERFVAQKSITLGSLNSGPQIGPLVISEILYSPLPEQFEYVELTNIAQQDLPLYGVTPENSYQIGGIGFKFPAGASLVSQAKALIVNTDPVSFKQTFDVPEEVQVYGPFGNMSDDATAALDDQGETITLRTLCASGKDDADYIDLDRVSYSNAAPWPNAFENGLVLRRNPPSTFGDNAANWMAAASSYPRKTVEEGEEEGDDVEEGEVEGEGEGETPGFQCQCNKAQPFPPMNSKEASGDTILLALSLVMFCCWPGMRRGRGPQE